MKWLGRRWRRSYRCEDFYLEVLREEFGREASFGPRTDTAPAEWDRLVAEGKPSHLRAVARAEAHDGDAVLMVAPGSRPRGHYHIGAFVAPGGVLHLPIGAWSMVTPLLALGSAGLELEGFYRCR